jgi:hypothetical protein
VFATNQYAPSTQAGRKLLGHELAHVLQQRNCSQRILQRKPIPVVEQQRQPLDLTPSKPLKEASQSRGIVDPFVTRVEEIRIFNQDDRFNEYRKIEYGEGWIDIGGGRQQKVQFRTETITNTPFDTWKSGWTSRKTDISSVEPVYRTAATPFQLEPTTRTKTEAIVNVPKYKPPKPKSLGMRVLAKVGGYYKGLAESVWGLVEGVYHVIRHPIQTVEGIGHIIRHPIRTLEALGHAIKSRGAAILSGDTEALGKTIGDIALLILAPEAEGAEAAKALEALDAAKGLEAADAAKLLDAADAATVLEAETAGVKAVKETEAAGKVADEAVAATKGGRTPETDIRGIVEENRNITIRGEEDVADAVKGPTGPSGQTGTRKRGRTPRTERGSKVETFERDVERAERGITQKSGELDEARQVLGEHVQSEYMPPDTKVKAVQTERTSAGRGQSRGVTPEDSPVGMDVEFRVDLPDSSRSKLGLPRRDPKNPQRGTIKFDGIEPQGSKFKILEHKEVESIWERSHFGRDRQLAEREIDEILNRHIGICDEIPKCSGVTFSSNDARLVDLMNERISILPRTVRERVSFGAVVK